MVERCEEMGLTAESSEPLGLPDEFIGEELERYFAAKSCIERSEDHAHTALSDHAEHVKLTDPLGRLRQLLRGGCFRGGKGKTDDCTRPDSVHEIGDNRIRVDLEERLR